MSQVSKTSLFAVTLLWVLLAAPIGFSQTLLQITSPSNQAQYTEGQTYTISLSADPSVTNIYVTTPSPLPAAQPTSSPIQFTLTLPTNIPPGYYNIGAIGATASGDVEAAPVMVDIERQDAPVSITAQPLVMNLQAVGQQAPISVWGTYADGTQLFISNSPQTHYKSANTQIATVGATGYYNGSVTSAGIGQTSITVGACSCLYPPYTQPKTWAPVTVNVTQPVTAPAPVITSLSTNVGTPGVTQVTVNGSNFGTAQGSGYLQLGTMSATTIASWTAGQIVATVPLGSMPGVAEVRQNGLASNDLLFTTTVPSITGLSPSSGTAGTPVTISGTNFGTTQGSSSVMFNRGAATSTSWGSGSIVAPVPASATTGNVVVIVNGTPSNAVSFTVVPQITSLQPPSGAIGAAVSVNGNNFGTAQNTSTVTFNGVSTTPTSWAAGLIGVTVPSGATSGPVVVTVNGVASNGSTFTLTAPPSITGLSVSSGAVGASGQDYRNRLRLPPGV
jgi:hypothetical protein